MSQRFLHIVAILVLPFVVVYTHGVSVAWLIYLHEWEDIVTHYCQEFSTEECDGKAFVNAVLDAQHDPQNSLPKPPVSIQEMRAILLFAAAQAHKTLVRFFHTDHHTDSPLRGYLRGVFRPPCIL